MKLYSFILFISILEESGAKNLAQVYTQAKYTEESHIKYSNDLLNYLNSQNFMR